MEFGLNRRRQSLCDGVARQDRTHTTSGEMTILTAHIAKGNDGRPNGATTDSTSSQMTQILTAKLH